MDEFSPAGFLNLSRITAEWTVVHRETKERISEKFAKQQARGLATYVPPLQQVGSTASLATLRKLIKEFNREGCAWPKIVELCKELNGRLVDEMAETAFFSLSPRDKELFDNPTKSWMAVVSRLPQVRDDIEEASKCYAFGRYPAAIYHSLQILEFGLVELGTFLRVADPHSGWTAVSHALNAVIRKGHKDRTKFERKNFPFLEQMQGLVEGLKNAWRNKISHSHGRLVLVSTEFSPEIAEEILLASRAFMRRLVDELPPPKLPRKFLRALR